ncbi:MAG: hypothetical protein L0Y44_07295 [Phycisphaerales bacterium]|nr:hypothetical protein [Phycisphaerales bacterium]
MTSSFPAPPLGKWRVASGALAMPCLLLTSAAHCGSRATFTPLGFLDPDNFGPVIAYGISADGSIVVGESNSPTGFQAFRWTAKDGIVGLGAFPNPGGFQCSSARACSADGSVIVGASCLPDSLNENGSPFRWTQETGMVWLGALGFSSGGVARGVSSDGSVVVGYSRSALDEIPAFRWTAETGMISLGDLPGGAFNSQAGGCSGNGAIIVGLASTSASPYNRSFQWTQSTGMTELVPTSFRDVNISRNGQFAIGGNNGRGARLNLVTGELLIIPHVAIPGLTTDSDLAWASNADGSVVVGMHNLSQLLGFMGRAFMWDAEHGTRIIRDVLIGEFGLASELAGWELSNATTVSDDGSIIAGYGFAPSGEQAAWIVTLPAPCPADIAPDGGNGAVDVNDLLAVISAWGEIGGAADLNDDGVVNIADLLLLISAWGSCP